MITNLETSTKELLKTYACELDAVLIDCTAHEFTLEIKDKWGDILIKDSDKGFIAGVHYFFRKDKSLDTIKLYFNPNNKRTADLYLFDYTRHIEQNTSLFSFRGSDEKNSFHKTTFNVVEQFSQLYSLYAVRCSSIKATETATVEQLQRYAYFSILSETALAEMNAELTARKIVTATAENTARADKKNKSKRRA